MTPQRNPFPDDSSEEKFVVYTPARNGKIPAYIAGGNNEDLSRSYYHVTENADEAQGFLQGNARQVANDLNRGKPEIGIGIVPGSEGRDWRPVRRAP